MIELDSLACFEIHFRSFSGLIACDFSWLAPFSVYLVSLIDIRRSSALTPLTHIVSSPQWSRIFLSSVLLFVSNQILSVYL